MERGDVPQFAPGFPEVQQKSAAHCHDIAPRRMRSESSVSTLKRMSLTARRNGETAKRRDGSPEDHRIMMKHATFLPYLDCIYLHIYNIHIQYYNVIHRFMIVYVRFVNRH